MNMKENYFLLCEQGGSDLAAEHLAQGRQIMHFHAAYIEPYNKMTLIKSFQLLEHRMFPFGESGCAVIDVSEWIGHENEDYLDAFVKFLHDTGRHIFVFTATCQRKHAMPLYLRIRCFMPVVMKCSEAGAQKSIAEELCASYGLDTEAAELLAGFVSEIKLPAGVGYAAIIREIIGEITANGDAPDVQAILGYAHKTDSLVCLFLGEDKVDELAERKEFKYAV